MGNFGGTETAQGYKVLNERVGLIYGDSITLERAQNILKGLEAKGFASIIWSLELAAILITI
jgi:nicotinamide phosphoribosyltransferase